MSVDEPGLQAPTGLDARPVNPVPTEAVSPEPLVEPPSPAGVPMAMIKEWGWLAAIVAVVCIGLGVFWRRSHTD